MEIPFLAILPGLLIWLAILLLPWRPWSTRESLDSSPSAAQNHDLSDITVLIPARNEALNIVDTLTALNHQGNNLNVILVDDQSTDNTAELAKSVNLKNLTIIQGTELDEGWSGKLWALEQGRQHVNTPYIILLDADIVLERNLIPVVLEKVKNEQLQMLSLMAFLKMQTFWEKLLMPAFIFFFKLLYPFHLSNKTNSWVAAAAGGFVFIETRVLEELGGFNCIKDALIDDCSLAKQVKTNHHKIWTGMTHSAISIRNYDTLSSIWHMVARTAYTQLFYSPLLLLLCTLLMIAAFGIPVAALLHTESIIFGLCILILQSICYLPTLRYYSMNPCFAPVLPLIGILYLVMTWSSAYRYYFAKGANWKGRYYN
ncbi:MAG: glycosyltransferase [Proteobacteria bacterium]|nr:glycosyltransferase [Pseudomonadota bacterium]NOG61359.1 glycosyltransferase [Pseudomonadota bacterium]